MLKACIIDSSQLIRERLVEMLSGYGIAVAGAADSVPGAKELIGRTAPDVIILDIALHLGTGFEVIEYARKKKSDTIIIVYTITNGQQVQIKAFEKGARYFLDKTGDFHSLKQICRNLSKQKSIQQNSESLGGQHAEQC
jgi:DNA-binding response OmpR family regulator